MLLFICGLLLLVAGYFVYGRLVERIVGADDRETPAVANADGVDFMVLPHWKNMLIQLLNIAGVGPVIGVILGIKFGSIVFIIIPIGNILGGAVHDFISGMMSLRSGGANLPVIIRDTLGGPAFRFFAIFMSMLLLLVVTVFINVPAQLVASILPGENTFWIAVGCIFVYYIIATLFPVDKIIGTLYPFFGVLLIVGSLAIFGVLLWRAAGNPEMLTESVGFQENMFRAPEVPIIPMLFVTIACGLLSGFHATQSPIIARTMKSEREARSSFYGMMVLEGVIAMIWAGAAMAFFNSAPEWMLRKPAAALNEITTFFLGQNVGLITVISVIVLAVTSGDTAMRSLRLSLAEVFKIRQKPILNRILICLPLIAVIGVLLAWSNQDAATFNMLWNYFAWGNQVLGAFTLTAGTVWLISHRRHPWITMIPGCFMTYIVTSYILWISMDRGKGAASAPGLGLDWAFADVLALIFASVVTAAAVERGMKKRSQEELSEDGLGK